MKAARGEILDRRQPDAARLALGRQFDRAVLPDSKSGQRTIWLATPARAILDALPRSDGCPWVFASIDGTPVSIATPRQAIRRTAELGGLRLHDLRHRNAAVAVGTGGGLRIVADLLCHSDIRTTFGYAHLAEASVFEAANRVPRNLAADGFQILPRRWVIERTFAWLGRCRRLAKDWEKTIASA